MSTTNNQNGRQSEKDERKLSEESVNRLLDQLQEEKRSVAIRRIIPNPEYSDRRHEYVVFDGCWHSGSITETQRSCILNERYRIRSALAGVPESQIDIVPIEETPMPYWLADLVRVGCPNHDDVWVSVNEMLLPKKRICAECGHELVADA